MKSKTIEELNQAYKEADLCDSAEFSEMRSNILLVAGEHYNKRNVAFWNRVRDTKELAGDQKLRITKNHIYKISKIRKNLILSHASGVRVFPNNESELQDQKSAEINQSVWSYLKVEQNIKKKTNQWVGDYFDIGECAAKIYWDPTLGKLIGYEQEVDDDGQPVADEMGQPVAGQKGVFSGGLAIERILPFNLLRSPDAKTMDDSPYLIYRKVVTHSHLMGLVRGDEEKEKMLSGGKDDTYLVFDSNKQKYGKEPGVVTLREHYYRACPEYPEGYFYISTEQGILWEGPLPYGVFPICYEGHDEVPTTPRHRSPLKQLRPWQIEINRASGKIAEHQVTLGDDKLVVQSGAKVTSGSILPGVRTIQVSGMAPTVLPGRSGDQYFAYIQGQIAEMYQAAMVPEDMEEKGDQDAWASLWKAVRHKKKFILDSEKFEGFLCRVCATSLDLARKYYDDQMIIPMIGRSEAVNIPEFKNTNDQCYQIKIEPASDDLETVMGKQLMLNHILQYSSAQLDKQDIGRLIRMMPMGNNEQAFADLTMDFDRATNILLALDRGQSVLPNKYDNGPYLIKRLTTRMSQSDFQMLHPDIQANYQRIVSLYEDLEAKKAQDMKAMQSDFIPTDGAQIKVAWYIKDPTNPSRSVQATLPASSINWLVQRLEEQGNGQAEIQRNGPGAQDVVQKYNELSGIQPGQDQQQPTGEMPHAAVTPNQQLLSKLQGVLQ